MKYHIDFTKPFEKQQQKLFKRNPQLRFKFRRTIQMLGNDPFHVLLHTHKVESARYGERWSSRVTGDIRIIWDFVGKSQARILALDVGGHSGKRKVYN